MLASVQSDTLTDAGLDQLIERIRSEFIGAVKAGIGRVVMFCDMAPVVGFWRYKDLLQILPAPPDAARPPFIVAQHPFLLEFQYAATENWQTNHLRHARKAHDVSLALNAFLNRNVWMLPNRSVGTLGNAWFINDRRIESTSQGSIYGQLGYSLQGFEPHAVGFTCMESIALLAGSEAQEYFNTHPAVLDVLTVPSDLAAYWERYFSLVENHPLHRRFLQACFWLNEIRKSDSFSLRLILAVQAIEALISPAIATASCLTCRREFRPGPTKLFQQFLDHFAPIRAEQSELRKALYRTRSGLTHGYRPPFAVDMRLSSSLNPLDQDERRTLGDAERVVRVAMRNWLCSDLARIEHIPEPDRKMFSQTATL